MKLQHVIFPIKKAIMACIIVTLCGESLSAEVRANDHLLSESKTSSGSVYPLRKADPLGSLPPDERNRILEGEVKRRTEMQQHADQPIVFYGRIIDQHGEPVPGVVVKAGIGAFGPVFRYGFPVLKNVEVMSDRDGRFAITGEKGISLSVNELMKTGYAFQHLAGIDYQEYPGQFSDSSKPYIVTAYKIDEPPPKLVIARIPFGFEADGRWYYLDLVNKVGHSGELGGDLQVRFQRADDATRTGPYDWDLTLEVNNGGGVIETADEPLHYVAPQKGYKSEWHIAYKKSDSGWKRATHRNFYLQSRHGSVYARCELDIYPFYNDEGKAVIEIAYWLNQNTSRNLFSTVVP